LPLREEATRAIADIEPPHLRPYQMPPHLVPFTAKPYGNRSIARYASFRQPGSHVATFDLRSFASGHPPGLASHADFR